MSVADFVQRLLAREGALVEREDPGPLFAVLPPDLAKSLALPESVALRVCAEAGPGEVGWPLEAASLQWCVERAAARGRLAAVRLPASHGAAKPAHRWLDHVTAMNATLRAGDAGLARIDAWVLEFRYEAHSEERAEGSVFVAAVPSSGALSAPLAEALLAELPRAEPGRMPEERPDLEAVARVAEPAARAEIVARLAPFRAARRERFAIDRERLVAYHDTLAAEAARRRGGVADAGEAALRGKIDAVARQRDAKLAELAERHSVRVRYALSSALLASYEAPVCEIVLRRRSREIRFRLVWDPFLHGPLPLPCAGCGMPGLAFHACDEQGHLTCPLCAARCPRCARVTCRACHGPGCRVCSREEDTGVRPCAR